MIRKIVYLVLCLWSTFTLGMVYGEENASGVFSIEKNEFRLNGEKFVIRSGELHYMRVPREYWKHRLQLMKAMGFNSVCAYVFWNAHEERPDVFNFSEQRDIATFCRLAQEEGLYVILRPGPYACAEWEMGGLPWWLLKKDNIKLRERDPYFLKRTEIFLKKVGEQLADLQITRGGPIIMVQVENEYSAYLTDKEYMRAIKKMLLDSGFTDVPLFTCDWVSNMKNNALDDVLLTINFGSNADAAQLFKEFSAFRPDSPRMCSEYWSGWFDRWGNPHENRSVESLMRNMTYFAENDISFSVYMAHGGSSFGMWAGANSPPYAPTCSSYDYDAPVSEAGWTTPKFFAVRELMEKHLLKGETVGAIPEPYPVIEIPSFELKEMAPLFSQLPKAKRDSIIRPMEFYDQGFGCIMYRTTIPPSEKRRTLFIDEVHDWACIYINGEPVATIDRRYGRKSIQIPPTEKNATLDIFVEAMGRVNFGPAIHDRKGITKKVELISEGVKKELFDWEVFNFPLNDENYLKSLHFKRADDNVGPAFYRGSFKLDKVGDTFFDLRGWGKGVLWVNGYCIGRFWKIGPQQTLYVPGCWLKKGNNTVLLIDNEGPGNPYLAGLSKPILDQIRMDALVRHRSEGQDIDLSGNAPVYTGSFAAGNKWQEVLFKEPVKGRYFCLEALSAHNGDQYASIAELYVLGGDKKPLPREEWVIVYADSEELIQANNSADNIFDLQESTYWHSEWSSVDSPKPPHRIVIDLGYEQTISGFRYLPRPEPNNPPGVIKDYKIYISETPFKGI